MKILLLCWRDSTHPQGGGSERYLERVGEYLVSQGHEVVFRTSRHMNAARREVRNGVRYSRGGAKYSVYPAALAMIVAARLGIGPLRGFDAVIDTQNGIPFFARLVSGKPTVLLTHHCHREVWPVAGRVIGPLGWFLESRVAPWVYRNSQTVTVSEASRADLLALGVPDAQIIENGVDPIPEHIPLIARETPIHLVTLSRLVPYKQIEHAIDTVAALDDATLDVIGSGWWEAELRAYARERGVLDKVIFHGQVTEDYKHALLARADIHLMPSRKEGWGLAVMEAAQHGVPTVGYSFGLRDSVQDNTTGLLVSDEQGFIDATRRLIRDVELREELGADAKDFALKFSWDSTGARFEELLRRLTQQ
ncbi:glycosyltransferase family 4 protein [Corynebacterium ammoniagenes]|uniref:glycosyltransferase family 4 protein n=1 Tax=Corynebacterium ammoniagenes TaxID=1697 RepID=UPI00145929F5|nr:glycosyltransferase family 4 protein [Corynebacterium ammoniagenes]NMF32074.1 glycosyltransferase family 4 protein [Corynebacterium ammoniagenes]